MKLTIYGSHQCPECVEAKKILTEKGIAFQFIDLSEDLHSLKQFLAFREQEEIYQPFREAAKKAESVSPVSFFRTESAVWTSSMS